MKDILLKKINNYKIIEIGYCIVSLLAIYSISLIDNRIGMNSILVPVITILMYYLINQFLKKKIKKRLLNFSMLFSLLFSLLTVIGTQLEVISEIIWNFSTITDIICLSVMILPISYNIFEYLSNIKIIKKIEANKKLYIISFLIIFIAGFLVFLAMYPGMYGYDAIFQINKVRNNAMDTHYSVIYCYYLNFFTQIADFFGKGHRFAIALYSLTQLIIMSSISSYVCYYIVKKSKSFIAYLIALLFYVLLLPYKIMVVSTAQDVLFAGVFVLVFINLLEYITNNDYSKKKIKNIIMGCLIILLCLLRNNGLYALIILILTFMLLRIKDYKYLLISIIIPILIFKIISGPVYKKIGVDLSKNEDNTIKEMSSIPGQQLARAYSRHKKNFGIQNKKELKKYYGELNIIEKNAYDYPSISDEIKAKLNTEYVKKDKIKYLIYWIHVGIKYPCDYIDAFGIQNLGLFYPFKHYYDSRMFHPLIEYRSLNEKKFTEESDKYYTLNNKSKFKEYDDYIRNNIQKNDWQNIPIVSLLYNLGFYFIYTILIIMMVIYKKRYQLFYPLGIIIGLYLTLFLAPVALYRYVFPIICVSPLYMYIIIYCNENRKKVGNKNEKK